MNKIIFLIVTLNSLLFSQVYSYGCAYGWYAFPAWGDNKKVEKSLYFGIIKEKEYVIELIDFDQVGWTYICHVKWKTITYGG
jgi:hypothetical protein